MTNAHSLARLSPSIRVALTPAEAPPVAAPAGMAYALISPNEAVSGGQRIAQTSALPFAVAPPLVWVLVPDSVTPDGFYWNGTSAVPMPPPASRMILAPSSGSAKIA